ncbi:MAG: hypothetical protein A3H32_10120 [Betaproteobacteria bacterium RIFCSPLOWO2_02_FULL_63_19]|nr:MAG: hypothetical protein A3H32_10120 [Betaproteobacteria bacterium RIFCSPLOWO2_02_FULL_63_19]
MDTLRADRVFTSNLSGVIVGVMGRVLAAARAPASSFSRMNAGEKIVILNRSRVFCSLRISPKPRQEQSL